MSVTSVERNFNLELIMVKNAGVVTLKCFIKWSRFRAVMPGGLFCVCTSQFILRHSSESSCIKSINFCLEKSFLRKS